MSMLHPVKYRFFYSLLIYTTQITILNIFLFFLFAPPQLSSLTKLFLGRKNIGGPSVLPCASQVMPMVFSMLNLF